MNKKQQARMNAVMARYQAAPVAIPMDDEPVHVLPDRPFCTDMDCLCHDDKEPVQEYLTTPWQNGRLTNQEAERLYRGQQIR